MRKLVLALGVPLFALAMPASAHFNLTMPPSIAKSTEGGKGAAPCGPDTATTGTPTPVTGGSTLKLNIDETVPHPGFYRFALSMTSPPTFPADNVVKDKNGVVLAPTSTGESATAAFEDPAKYPVLADHMFVHSDGAVQSFPSAKVPGQVTVPNMNCEKCTLQVIEFMAIHGSNGPSAGFFYHHCALLKITVDPSKPVFDPNAAGGAGGGSAGGAAGAAGSAGASSAGAAGALTAGSGGTAGDSAGGAPGAGAPATGGSPGSAGFGPGGASSVAGSAQVPIDSPDAGGCSVSARSVGSKVWLSVLVCLVVLGGRRRRRSC